MTPNPGRAGKPPRRRPTGMWSAPRAVTRARARRAGRGQVRGKCRARAYSEPSARPTSIWRSLPSREMRTSQGLQHTSQS